ncbi:DUF3833 domain-containing protein [Allorhizobium sp. BGMRC 0089]|uniref:DUF3833 family protein n=1 Tax=Allorhizobium sonneratiae TaxID=2934936 RepID=UPI00203384DE|nr:DUF3833 family protein [Allorhizobium sonneratiae]MCM2293966.1 DUF3833 domain-containing protein [Allorhizobium sonneratiae]
MIALMGVLIGFAASAMPSKAAPFRFEDYFVGTTWAEGHFSAITGVRRDFKVRLTGRWNGHRLRLREDFDFADGKKDRKTWTFVKTASAAYTGTRDDVIGDAKVSVTGDTARFSYLVYLSPQTRSNIVRFHDKMVLQPDGIVLNTAWVTKFGLPVARTTVVFHKPLLRHGKR